MSWAIISTDKLSQSKFYLSTNNWWCTEISVFRVIKFKTRAEAEFILSNYQGITDPEVFIVDVMEIP